ncbi:hypothetical protein NLM27_41790 [Bradyrhizobium sp. CCGB12]|uniref:hypothetical protein n=1 Tax=Bradyrhizobium sp. CCGB12 TaxID=2949632 RepID=UPI0020B2D6E4|nr:hypothetical protein [Bradyrhizobium sp. CCGB12]MCP3395267.1 hypothetical protein [Bradyrhizobium sp. CCGB12]
MLLANRLIEDEPQTTVTTPSLTTIRMRLSKAGLDIFNDPDEILEHARAHSGCHQPGFGTWRNQGARTNYKVFVNDRGRLYRSLVLNDFDSSSNAVPIERLLLPGYCIDLRTSLVSRSQMGGAYELGQAEGQARQIRT